MAQPLRLLPAEDPCSFPSMSKWFIVPYNSISVEPVAFFWLCMYSMRIVHTQKIRHRNIHIKQIKQI